MNRQIKCVVHRHFRTVDELKACETDFFSKFLRGRGFETGKAQSRDCVLCDVMMADLDHTFSLVEGGKGFVSGFTWIEGNSLQPTFLES